MHGPEQERITLKPSEERKSYCTNGSIKLTTQIDGKNLSFFANPPKEDEVDAKKIQSLIKEKNYAGILKEVFHNLVIQDQDLRAKRYYASKGKSETTDSKESTSEVDSTRAKVDF